VVLLGAMVAQGATLSHMQRVPVRELRNNLSRWLRRVQDGEAFEVTDRGKPVALLSPLPRARDPITLLEQRGQVARRGNGEPFVTPTLRTPVPTARILDELREDKA
jgi:prevent-host-death family protein